ncbi:MAG: hypothetical protein ACK5II_12195 [Paracoccus sp. (in: a-proteobacteria)]
MTRTTTVSVLGLTGLILAACGISNGESSTSGPDAMTQSASATGTRPAARSVQTTSTQSSDNGILQSGGKTVAQLDTTSAAEKAAATAPGSGGRKLGITTASLGDASEGGFWIKTSLVSTTGKGRVVDTASGKSAKVDLKPMAGDGAGGRVSLATMQALDLTLTDLPDLEVWQD